MKIYKVFTAALDLDMALLQCRQHKPFEAPMVGWMGTYEARGWWFVRSPEVWGWREVRCANVQDPEMIVSSVDRNIVCGGQSGDLMVWSYVSQDVTYWSWVKFLGMGVAVSVGCYTLPADPGRRY